MSADKVEAKAQAEYSRFLISRARATGARSLTEIQKWYFDVMAYRRAMDSVENLPKSSKTRADDDQDTSKENTGGEIK